MKSKAHDVNAHRTETPPTSSHEFAVRRRAMELCRDDPDRFFAVVRDSDRRELTGADPVDALEQALDAASA